MLKFILRRLVQAFGVMLGASVLVYVLVINSGDPLADLRESNARNRDYLIQQRIEFMELDLPWWQRYLDWLGGVSRCVIGQCDFGTNRQGVDVGTLLGQAAASTLRLVLLATVLALIIGVAVGILTAVRQYSGLDYAVTFGTFLFFSLPVFWAAVLLKEYLAIGFNNWLQDPGFTPLQIILIAVVIGFVMQVLLAGSVKRRVATFAVTAVFFAVVLPTFTALDLFRNPQLGMIGVAVLTFAVALSVTAMTVGLRNREVLVPALITAAGVSIMQLVLYNVFVYYMNWGVLILGVVLAVALPWVLARFMSHRYRSQAIIAATVTGVIGAGLTMLDHLFRVWPNFLGLKPRPISTIGSQTPNFRGGFWETFLDYGTQMLLPTLLLTLISLASYSRYTRTSMLEVNRQDYIRTARAKGAPERTVIFRHALRNALIPIATIAAFDFAALIGGAVITERVFGWKGMGDLFASGLDQVDPAPVMAFFLITGGVAVLFNLLADISYAYLDPRIRV
ncbi:ABC transporter permease [Microbacterium sp. zg.Y625]|uniref:ABC transporter permease n=1 Tax=Microbacterium jiangjiandongii TaxID=3049071 RepID=UPI00214B1871|nr:MULTISPECIES: ABC transporter permease [unclassified Microbacterium]MCR2793135.1 ABC transporter permease [Microbacterium sp. zg.Y625]MCR2817208.1 ABC transporter permease [Microbacterium sp. zg.Y843]WIM24243.1 ABC transporter permease [Microbacterium sp. zg-Y625]